MIAPSLLRMNRAVIGDPLRRPEEGVRMMPPIVTGGTGYPMGAGSGSDPVAQAPRLLRLPAVNQGYFSTAGSLAKLGQMSQNAYNSIPMAQHNARMAQRAMQMQMMMQAQSAGGAAGITPGGEPPPANQGGDPGGSQPSPTNIPSIIARGGDPRGTHPAYPGAGADVGRGWGNPVFVSPLGTSYYLNPVTGGLVDSEGYPRATAVNPGQDRYSQSGGPAGNPTGYNRATGTYGGGGGGWGTGGFGLGSGYGTYGAGYGDSAFSPGANGFSPMSFGQGGQAGRTMSASALN